MPVACKIPTSGNTSGREASGYLFDVGLRVGVGAPHGRTHFPDTCSVQYRTHDSKVARLIQLASLATNKAFPCLPQASLGKLPTANPKQYKATQPVASTTHPREIPKEG